MSALAAAVAEACEIKPAAAKKFFETLAAIATEEVKKNAKFVIPGIAMLKTRKKPATKAGLRALLMDGNRGHEVLPFKGSRLSVVAYTRQGFCEDAPANCTHQPPTTPLSCARLDGHVLRALPRLFRRGRSALTRACKRDSPSLPAGRAGLAHEQSQRALER